MLRGYIPEEVLYVTTTDGKVFVTTEKSKETALRWAGNRLDLVQTRTNTPLTGIRITGLESRLKGRVFKCALPDGLIYDFREDALLDVVLEAGCEPGGKLNGEYVFGVKGSQMRLIRVGSTDHKRLLASMEAKKNGPIKDLVVGHEYQTRDEYRSYVYLGKVDGNHYNYYSRWTTNGAEVTTTPSEPFHDKFLFHQFTPWCREFQYGSYWGWEVLDKPRPFIMDLGPVEIPTIEEIAAKGETPLLKDLRPHGDRAQ
jgi:hypothetical protein